MGGMIAAVESGYANQLIADSAWEQQLAFEQRRARRPSASTPSPTTTAPPAGIELFQQRPGRGGAPDGAAGGGQALARGAPGRARRCASSRPSRRDLHRNRMPLIEEAVRARATVGEICDVLRSVWGEYRPSTVF